MRRTTTLAALLALLGAGPANAQQLRLDLKPTLTFTTAATLDLATTVLGVEYGSCEGERNPRYWGPGNNWREPRYDLMARDTAILTGASAGLQYLTHRMRRAHPEHRLLRVADYAVKGFVYGVAAARGYAAARNVVRCTR